MTRILVSDRFFTKNDDFKPDKATPKRDRTLKIWKNIKMKPQMITRWQRIEKNK